MDDARDRIEEWRCQYNEDRPHSALGNLTANAFADQASKVAWLLDLKRGAGQATVKPTLPVVPSLGAGQAGPIGLTIP